jgi:hypothetical protein
MALSASRSSSRFRLSPLCVTGAAIICGVCGRSEAMYADWARRSGLVGVSMVVVDEPERIRDGGGIETAPYSVVGRLGRYRTPSASLSLWTVLGGFQLPGAATRCMKAVPAEADFWEALSISSCGEGITGKLWAGPFLRFRGSLSLIAARALWHGFGVLVPPAPIAGHLASGVSGTDLALPCDLPR